jgi:hypothetical protein
MGMPSTRETPTLSFVGTIVSAADQAKGANGAWRSVEVRVNEVVQSPPALPDIKGATVTVHLAESETAVPGSRSLFRVVGVSYGEHLVVRAIDVLPDDGSSRATTRQQAASPVLIDLVRTAEAIVSGQVLRRQATTSSERLTEHDPANAIVQVRVVDTIKGVVPPVIEVAMPTSSDVLSRLTTTPEVGDIAIFFLGHNTEADSGSRSIAYAANDVHAIDGIERVRAAAAQL